MKKKFRKIYIGESKTHGKGLFASRNIKKGEIIFYIKGKKINFFITDEKKAEIAGLNWIGVGKNKWLDPQNEYGAYFNHSCEPSSAIKGRVTVVALRNIKKDEEITFDYSTTEGDIFWSMKCACGAKKCRGVIRSVQFLPTGVYKKYSFHIPEYYKMVYKDFNLKKMHDRIHLKEEWVRFLLGHNYVK